MKKAAAGSKPASFNMEEEMQGMRKVKPVAAHAGKEAKKHKKASSKAQHKGGADKQQSLSLEEQPSTKKFEEDQTGAASTVVNEVVTMVGACKHPATWCTGSLSMDEQTKLNDASS